MRTYMCSMQPLGSDSNVSASSSNAKYPATSASQWYRTPRSPHSADNSLSMDAPRDRKSSSERKKSLPSSPQAGPSNPKTPTFQQNDKPQFASSSSNRPTSSRPENFGASPLDLLKGLEGIGSIRKSDSAYNSPSSLPRGDSSNVSGQRGTRSSSQMAVSSSRGPNMNTDATYKANRLNRPDPATGVGIAPHLDRTVRDEYGGAQNRPRTNASNRPLPSRTWDRPSDSGKEPMSRNARPVAWTGTGADTFDTAPSEVEVTPEQSTRRGADPRRDSSKFKSRGSLVGGGREESVSTPTYQRTNPAARIRTAEKAAAERKKKAKLYIKPTVPVYIPSIVTVSQLARLLNVKLGMSCNELG